MNGLFLPMNNLFYWFEAEPKNWLLFQAKTITKFSRKYTNEFEINSAKFYFLCKTSFWRICRIFFGSSKSGLCADCSKV